ncbi:MULTISPECIES: DUF3173 family protein [unclassified Enterococcus]|nr:DUF3173 family protein [Enterococcus sp. MMGLQ5-2]MBS7583326.1 DUF3173 family protein [Enterococcus sp. MMGLQ5-1]NPD11186.1 DUF3173 family protein [Enterococcus sp. MMGLQ5-1]NPD35929.1 DUF3173 family protein [Enterococcus sp. MMGLQ5-2]
MISIPDTITKDDLVKIDYSNHTATMIIRQSKQIMIQQEKQLK